MTARMHHREFVRALAQRGEPKVQTKTSLTLENFNTILKNKVHEMANLFIEDRNVRRLSYSYQMVGDDKRVTDKLVNEPFDEIMRRLENMVLAEYPMYLKRLEPHEYKHAYKTDLKQDYLILSADTCVKLAGEEPLIDIASDPKFDDLVGRGFNLTKIPVEDKCSV